MRRTYYLLLAIRLSVEIYKVHSLPYETGPGGSCKNANTEYVPEGSNLCCKKCLPGTRFRKQCSATTETECEQCPETQYIDTYHYIRNCLKCSKCNEDKGLQYFQKCSKTTQARCTCQPGKYCITGFKSCEECMSYTSCKPGHGVSRNGSADSDVKCAPCPDGTFSDMLSYTQPCQRHTDCKAQGSVMLHPGNATSDSVCEGYNPQTTIYPKTPTEPETTTLQATTVAPNTTSTQKETSSKPKTTFAPSDEKLSHKGLGNYLYVLLWSFAVFGVLAVLTIVMLVLFKIRQRDYKINNSNTDSNGNFEVVNLKDPPFTSLTSIFREQQCLLTTGHHSNNISQAQPSLNGYSGNQENKPMPLHSTTQMITYQTQPSPHPSSPQSPVSPLPSSPLVNFNITLNVEMGNGCCSAPSSLPTDSLQNNFTNPPFPLGKEEECVSVAQQEEGKEVLIAVQESEHS
ncbi:tumor necrosis factor receptor superfamily member 1B isoform X1 [Osmerus mordax]|uniref:tumor necrosis factor receptor superfamily member 1B isoform X1 n=1 Tax=Osmerus mordax TaxID=8014 RepID=UPI00350ED735